MKNPLEPPWGRPKKLGLLILLILILSATKTNSQSKPQNSFFNGNTLVVAFNIPFLKNLGHHTVLKWF